eukprot:c13185_g2_i1.p2 GENE.c13185_g2_i1~~c13185_g2_i1.p2  ORF type:complete len:147 (-),score=33.90 c13185_g2_i1:2-442(-)
MRALCVVVTDNFLGAGRMKRVCGVLRHMSHITSLDLGITNLEDEDVKYVCDCIHNKPNLESLILAHNDAIKADGVTYFCEALANKHHLTHLDLYGIGMGSKGVRRLLPCLTQLSKLSDLDIRNNDVDNETKQEVQRLLPHVKDLRL